MKRNRSQRHENPEFTIRRSRSQSAARPERAEAYLGYDQAANLPPPPRIPTPEVQHVAEAAKPAPFLALDTLFKSTIAKPKLYFLPVAADLADKRLDELDSLTTRRGEIPPGGSGYRDSRRYTFEDGALVDGGPEFGLRAERGGPRARGGRGGRGGGWRGR